MKIFSDQNACFQEGPEEESAEEERCCWYRRCSGQTSFSKQGIFFAVVLHDAYISGDANGPAAIFFFLYLFFIFILVYKWVMFYFFFFFFFSWLNFVNFRVFAFTTKRSVSASFCLLFASTLGRGVYLSFRQKYELLVGWEKYMMIC